ncbi:MAG: hypothetical protein Q4C50_12000 [Eubacteriales bacterium]|nr:hypothetical protein [Eubacteriales bacterium]
MRRKNGFLTIVLILLSIAGVAVAVMFLREEGELDSERQAKVAQLSEQLQPLNEERKEWDAQDKEWLKRLEEKKKGKSCVLLNFDNMSENLYETVFELMDQYGFRGTFAFRNGRLPGWGDTDMSRDEFDEMMHSGWEYALSIGEEHEEQDTSVSYWERATETESETETSADEGDGSDEAGETESYLAQLDDFISTLEGNGVTASRILFCDSDQYQETTERALAERGFQMVCVKDEQEFPVLGERGETIWKIDAGIYNQKDTDIEELLEKTVESGESLAIYINDVQKLSQDAEYDLSLTRFTSLLNKLKAMEEEGRIYLLTYSELNQYEEQQAEEYEQLTKEYAAFRREMEEALAQVDEQESAIVEESRQTEAEESLLQKVKRQLGLEKTDDTEKE